MDQQRTGGDDDELHRLRLLAKISRVAFFVAFAAMFASGFAYKETHTTISMVLGFGWEMLAFAEIHLALTRIVDEEEGEAAAAVSILGLGRPENH